MEGIPDHTSRRPSRGGGYGGLGGSFPAVRVPAKADPEPLAKASGTDGRNEGEATGMSEARSRKEPWEDNAHVRVGSSGMLRPSRKPKAKARLPHGPPKRSRAS